MTMLTEIWAHIPEPNIRFRVHGLPQTKGSTKAIYIEKLKRAITTNANPKNKGWAALVASVAQEYAPKEGLWTGPVAVYLHFYLYPPKTLLKKEKFKTIRPAKRPDLDKMVRSVNDALTGIIFDDDKQIVNAHEVKQYSTSPGVEILIINLDGKGAV